MGTGASSHSQFFTYAIEDKIEEVMDSLPDRVNLLIERLIPMIRETDVSRQFDDTMLGHTPEELNKPEVAALLLRNFMANPEAAQSHVKKVEREAVLLHCKTHKIDPATMTDDEIREKEQQIFKKCRKYIACTLRNTLNEKRQGFIDAMASAEPTTRPKVIFDAYMEETYTAVDSAYEFTYGDVMCYLNNVLMPGLN